MGQRFFNVALLLWGGMFCLMAAFCLSIGKEYNYKKRIWLMHAQLAAAVLLLSDGLAWYVQGQPGKAVHYIMYITNFIVYAGLYLVLLTFHGYICCYLLDEGKKHPLCARLVEGCCILGIAMVFVSQFSELFYYIDEQNIYHRSPTFPISMAVLLVAMVLESYFLVSNRQRLTSGRFTAMCACIVLPLVASVSQLFHNDISLIDVAIGAMMIMLFVVATTSQNRELAMAEKSREQFRQRLEIATTLNHCVEKLSSGNSVGEGLDNLLKTVNGYFNSDRTYVFEIDFDRNVLVNTYEYVRGQEVSAQKDNLQEVPMDVIAVWMESFRKGHAYYIPELEQERGTPTYEMLQEQQVWRLLAVPLLRDDEVIGFLGVDNPTQHYEDATLLASIQFFITSTLERRKQQQYLEKLSYQDTLTGLFNRNKYIEVLEMNRKDPPEKVGAIYIDLNGLKKINDQKGHRAGDELIVRAAQALREVFPGDAYRVGGDEFVVLTLGMEQPELERRVARLEDNMRRNGVDVSVGVVWQEHAADLEELLRRADERMYRQKKRYYAQQEGITDNSRP